jgi:uncharacterized protein
MNSSASIGPVDPKKRLETVDMVRGFALFGVMLVNMFNFGAASSIWTDPVDVAGFSVMRFFFETKSWRLFSFLFGFGFALQMLRADERQAKFLPTYIRRLAILFCIGLVHALFYDGDILMYYAELGLILLLFRKMSANTLLVIAAALLLAFPVERVITSTLAGPPADVPTVEVRLENAQKRIEERRQTHPYAVGTVRDVMVENAKGIAPSLNLFTDLRGVESTLPYFAMFLLGLYAGRRRFFHDIPRHIDFIRKVFYWGLTLGVLGLSAERLLSVTADYVLFDEQRATILPQLAGDLAFVVGSTALALGYAATIVLAAQHPRWRRIVMPLAAVGRMALTIYLLGSLMFTTLFYGYGFGQVFMIGPAAVLTYAIVFFAIQIIIANWWLTYFRFGPMEWLWRSLTYMKVQPLSIRQGV